MRESIRVLAGDCTVSFEDADADREQRGAVVVVVKPDDTVLVHDAGGYRPAAWLTRAETVQYGGDDDPFWVRAADGDQTLSVACHEEYGHARYPASPAGAAVGDCRSCGAPLVRAGSRVICIDCGEAHAIPRDATVVASTCDCGLPRMRVERGAAVEVCVDYSCEPLVEAVAERFDGAWTCPDCRTPMGVGRERGLRATCPDCDRAHAVPAGTVGDDCACGLPTFERGDGARCLDPACAG